MNIKAMDPYKREIEEIIKILPIDKMEFDIQSSGDPLIQKLYNRLLDSEHHILDHRYKKIIHNSGILGIYTLFDPCYRDVITWICGGLNNDDLQPKMPDKWRINTVFKEKNKCK